MTLIRVICRHKARKAVKIPKAKNFTEGDIISALRSTVPRPTLALPWAEGWGEKKNFIFSNSNFKGTQHEQTFDFSRNDIGEDNADLLKRKELGVKAAEHVLRQMKVEFDYDASKVNFSSIQFS